MQALRRLMVQANSSPTITFTYFAHTGITANAFTASSSVPWIIDFGASDHMTGCSSIFDSYSTCSGKDKVRIADGSFSAISGIVPDSPADTSGNDSSSIELPLINSFDLPITLQKGDDVDEILNLKSCLAQEFEIKDLGSLRCFLGWKWHDYLIEANHHLNGDMGKRTNKKRYLKSAPGILFSNHGHLQLEVFTDVDWAGSVDDRRSKFGYCTFLGGNLVTWRSKK
ncbi:hypothetical protein Acr_00g0036960 [Actinidia rufa]|uniref:Retrovirus-related Pol polyprotein from transposon TNT 1-94-like beta-barrel domain-containing protein n=1 Tax=Actinidia rufa TaxID=165716 RepID=A0A7J0DGU6_9ERIC|nr:hypothetical protein Acr_00g0036960 [Actinidia rufa]